MDNNEFKPCRGCGKKIKVSAKFCNGCGMECPTDYVPQSDKEKNEKDENFTKCRGCGASLKPGAKFCGKCGASLADAETDSEGAIDKRAEKKPQKNPQEKPHKNPQKNPPAQSKSRTAIKPFRITAAVLAVAILAGAVIWRDKISGGFRGNVQGTDSSAVSGTKAVDVTPVKGLRITAPKNAMDKDRSFTASILEDKNVPEYVSKQSCGEMPLMYIKVDSGMKPEDIFTGEATMSFNLKDLGIPENIWRYMSIVRYDDSGNKSDMVSNLEGSELKVNTRKSCIFELSAAIAAVSLGITISTSLYNDAANKYNYLGDSFYKSYYNSFAIYWPSTLPLKNKAEVDRVDNEWKDLWTKYNLETDENGRFKKTGMALAKAFSQMAEDENYKKLYALRTSREWLEQNYWPDRVTMAYDSLEKAKTYLNDVKCFKKPDFIIDILMLTQWPHADALGLEMSPPFQNGFIFMNVTDEKFYSIMKIITPKGNEYTPKGGAKDLKNSLNMTTLHELFHLYQDEYLNIRANSYTWFMEAAAVTLENEANDYYTNTTHWNTSLDILTDRDAFETLRNPLPEMSEAYAQKHGYNFSLFLDYLRDNPNIYGKDKKDFVKNLMTAFSGWLSDSVSAVYKGVGCSADQLSEQFRTYCNAPEAGVTKNILSKVQNPGKTDAALLKDILQVMDDNNPIYTWKFSGIKPLSVDYRVLSLASVPEQEMKNSKLYIVNNANFKDNKIYHNIAVDGYENISSSQTAWPELNSDVTELPGQGKESICLQRIDANTSTGWLPIDAMDVSVLLMPQPDAPKLTLKENTVNIEIQRSKFKEAALNKGYAVAYEVSVAYPGSEKPYTILVDSTKQSLDVDIAKLTNGKGIKDGTVSVTYVECAAIPGREQALKGPASREASITGKPDHSFMVGTWTGSSMQDVLFENPVEYKNVEVQETWEIKPYNKNGYEFEIINTVVCPAKNNESAVTHYVMNFSGEPDENGMQTIEMNMLDEVGTSSPVIGSLEIKNKNNIVLLGQDKDSADLSLNKK